MNEIEQVLDFWFGSSGADGALDPARQKMWFGDGRRYDAAVRETFGALHARASRGEERDTEVAAGREDRRRAQAAEQPPGLGHRDAQADRIQDEVRTPFGRSERPHAQLVVRPRPRFGHEPTLEAAGAAHVVELNRGTQIAQRPSDGQCGVDVPAGPAA